MVLFSLVAVFTYVTARGGPLRRPEARAMAQKMAARRQMVITLVAAMVR